MAVIEGELDVSSVNKYAPLGHMRDDTGRLPCRKKAALKAVLRTFKVVEFARLVLDITPGFFDLAAACGEDRTG